MSTGWITLAAIGYVVLGLITSRSVYIHDCWKRDKNTGKWKEKPDFSEAFWSFVLWPLVWVLGLVFCVGYAIYWIAMNVFKNPVKWWYTPTPARKQRKANAA